MPTAPYRDSSPTARVVTAAFAIAAHGSLLAVAVLRPERPPPPAEAPAAELAIDVDSLVSPSPSEPARALPSFEPRERPTERRRVARAQESPSQTAPIESAAPAGAPETTVPASPEAPWAPSWTVPRGIDLALDRATAWQPDTGRSDAGASTNQGETANADPGLLRAGLEAADRAAGISRNGGVVAAVHDIALTLGSVRQGSADLEITTDASGAVVGVRVLGASSDAATWRDAADALREALRRHTIVVPEGARGLAITVRVEVALRLPSGAAAGRGVSPFVHSDGANAGVGFDVSDIGARARPSVHARLVSERRL